MSTLLDTAKKKFTENVVLYPHLTEELADLFDMMIEEIEDGGGSADNEAEHFISSMDELIQEEKV